MMGGGGTLFHTFPSMTGGIVKVRLRSTDKLEEGFYVRSSGGGQDMSLHGLVVIVPCMAVSCRSLAM
eukprot:767903-Hanusia_phi.AAC.14